MSTERLFLDDPYLREFDAVVTDSADGWALLSRTAFHPGGGGQPFDIGRLSSAAGFHPVTERRSMASSIGPDAMR